MIFIRYLVWDEWNRAHIARHNVTPDEVEEICLTANPQTEDAKKGRIRVTGLTKKGRIISAFLDPEPEKGVYYPVSARDASKPERKSYNEWRKESEKAA
jgi:uncharacterized DUF497 family protein